MTRTPRTKPWWSWAALEVSVSIPIVTVGAIGAVAWLLGYQEGNTRAWADTAANLSALTAQSAPLVAGVALVVLGWRGVAPPLAARRGHPERRVRGLLPLHNRRGPGLVVR